MSPLSTSSLQRRLRQNGDHGKADQLSWTSILKMRQSHLSIMHNYHPDKVHSTLILLTLTLVLTLMTVTATQ